MGRGTLLKKGFPFPALSLSPPKTFDWWGGRAEGFVPAVGTGEFFHPRSLRGTPWINSYSSGTAQLERLNWKVDYVITHCAPTAIQQKINADFKQDKLTEFLNEIQSRSQFHYWLFGHYHDNRIIDEKYVMLYEQMVRVL